jgi:hypothetical protein
MRTTPSSGRECRRGPFARPWEVRCPRAGTLDHGERGTGKNGKTQRAAEFRNPRPAKRPKPDPARPYREDGKRRLPHMRQAFAPGPVFWLRTFRRSPSHPARWGVQPAQTVAYDRSQWRSSQRRVRVGFSPTSLRGAHAPLAYCRPRARVILTRSSSQCKAAACKSARSQETSIDTSLCGRMPPHASQADKTML